MDEILKKKIENAKEILINSRFFIKNGSKGHEETCFSFYVSTNENLNYYYQLPSMKGKDVLVPTASGDHAINAIFLGAKSVETFDINEFAFMHYNLKETAIKCLSREQFIDFYTVPNILDKKIYDKFSNRLKPETKIFFDAIYDFLESAPHLRECRDEYMFHLIEDSELHNRRVFVDNNPYLKNEKTFNQTRERILKTTVAHKLCPAHEVGFSFSSKDVVVFSNILRYYFGSHYENSSYSFLDPCSPATNRFIKSLSRVLKNDGYASLLYSSMHCPEFFEYLGIKTEQMFVEKRLRYGDILEKKVDKVMIAKKADNPILMRQR